METSKRILALDPGNSTGWCYRENDGKYIGGTVGENLEDVYQLIEALCPTVIIFETFQLYPSKATKMMWNTFYPCEVIGVIKLAAQQMKGRGVLVGLQPGSKKFSGVTNDWKNVEARTGGITEHTRDAYKLLRFYERNKDKLVK